MDYSKRQITKIAREVSKFTVQTMKEDGIGTAEFDFIHLLRHHPELTQAQIREELKIDKGAAARQAASLEAKGYLIRKENPADGAANCSMRPKRQKTCGTLKFRSSKPFMNGCCQNCPKKIETSFAGF